MDESAIIKEITSNTERSKSNKINITELEQRTNEEIKELKSDIKEIKQDQKAIYELTASIKVLVIEVSSVKNDVVEIKEGQATLSKNINQQISEVNKRVTDIDEKGKVDFILYFKTKILPFILGGGFIGGAIFLIEKIKK